jgi:hypothetical protein
MKKISYLLVTAWVILLISCGREDHAPTITLLGENPAETGKGYPYTDAGATASDEEDGDITSKIQVTSDVDTGAIGTYHVRYNVTDSDGNKATEAVREVIVRYYK